LKGTKYTRGKYARVVKFNFFKKKSDRDDSK
jgi:hypothetical protein